VLHDRAVSVRFYNRFEMDSLIEWRERNFEYSSRLFDFRWIYWYFSVCRRPIS